MFAGLFTVETGVWVGILGLFLVALKMLEPYFQRLIKANGHCHKKKR